MVRFFHDQIYGEYQRYIGLARTAVPEEHRYRGASEEEVTQFQAYLSEKAEGLQKNMNNCMDSIGAQYQLQIKWSIIRTNWNTLNEYVRLQRLERSLEWFKEELDAELMNRLSGHDHPLTDFMRVHSLGSSTSVASMSAALEQIQKDAKAPTDELAAKLVAGYAYGSSGQTGREHVYAFGHKQVEGHQEAAQDAQRRLLDLQRVVEDVEREGWPRNHTRPVEPR